MSTPPTSDPFVPPKGGFHMLRNERIQKEQRLRLLTRLVIGLCVLLLVYIIGRAAIPAPAPGGLDGCLRTADDAPLPATLRVGDQVVSSDPDGCFYFAAVPAGSLTLRAEMPAGVWQQPVTIQSGQATALGNLVIDPSEVTK
jgi:hypothetical protein